MLVTPFWLRIITKDPDSLAHLNVQCPDDRYPKLKIDTSEMIYTMEEERTLAVFESKILRKIYGTVKENESWRTRQNDELETIIKGQNIVRFNKCQRIRWLGHIERMQDTAIPKKMLYGKLYATRRRGRPRMRWLDDVSMDLRKMGINEWRDRARNRETWRHILAEAKAHPGL